MFKVCLVHEDAQMPLQMSKESAGYDLASIEDVVVPPNSRTLIRVGLKMFIPLGYYGSIASRSGLASNHFVFTAAGIIDSDYRGEIKILLFNFSNVPYQVKKGDHIAQIIYKQHVSPQLIKCDPDELPESERGEGGFGSTQKPKL